MSAAPSWLLDPPWTFILISGYKECSIVSETSHNKYSKRITQDESQPAAQAMLHAIGLSREDLRKPFVGIASTGYEGNPCNMHLNQLALHVKDGVLETNLVGLIFNTIGVSDGISMGTPGMRFSLPSRDIIADSMETVVSMRPPVASAARA